MFLFKHDDKDISSLVEHVNMADDADQAARSCEFTIAYNTKDELLEKEDIKLGDTFYVFYQDETEQPTTGANSTGGTTTSTTGETTDTANTSKRIEVFRGKVFYRERDTSNVVMRFTAYDNLIYLAKSKTTRKFKNITVADTITQVVNELGLTLGELPEISTAVDFIADTKTGIEIIKQALGYEKATTGKVYSLVMNEGLLNVVLKGTGITGDDDFKITDDTNLEKTTYSESVEDMVNQIMIVDKDGNTSSYVTVDDQVSAYGMIQDVYKIDEKQNTQTQAGAKLKGITYKCSLSAIGDVRCKSGYCINVKDEQLWGKFFIKSDRHEIAGNVHKMDLELEYVGAADDDKKE